MAGAEIFQKMSGTVIDVLTLRQYFEMDKVLISEHASMRFRQRGLKLKDVRYAVCNGEIIEHYPQDFPFPSCLILGKMANGRYLHVVMSDEGSMSRIITAYYPDPEKWDKSFTTRKDD